MARSRSVARIASRVPGPRVDPLRGIRNFVQTSPWLAIAIAAHVILGATFAVVQLAHTRAEADDSSMFMPTISHARPDDEAIVEPDEDIIRRDTIPDDAPVELIAPDTPVNPPEPLVDIDYTLPIGDPDANPAAGSDFPEGLPGESGGTSIGVDGPGHEGWGPSTTATTRLGNVGVPGGKGPEKPYGRPNGPTRVIDEAILNGMLWLARHQDESGRWSGATCAQICQAIDPEHPCQPETALEAGLYSTQADVGMTSLALLAFLGAGFSTNSNAIIVDELAGQKIRIGKDVVLPGLKWLASQQRPDGSFSDAGGYFLYNEALATLALCEAYGLSRSPYFKKRAQLAVDFICQAQKPNPTDPGKRWGWRYQPAQPGGAAGSQLSESDASVTGWMVMALESARLAGLAVPQASIDGALDFVRWSTAERGLVGYLGPDTAGDPIVGEHGEFAYHTGTMSAIGMCVRIFLEHNLADPALHQGADVLAADLPAIGQDPDAPQVDYYYWYYGSLALNQIDGPDAPRATSKYWGPWNKAMNETILAMQDQTKGACSYGGWMRPDRWSYGFGPVYTTAINVLTLEVYYRYENAFGSRKTPRSVAAPKPGEAVKLVSEPAAAPVDR
jgi:hypothetical protein